MAKTYVWKTEILHGNRVIGERYNFRIYKNDKIIEELDMDINTFRNKFLETADREELYIKLQDVERKPPSDYRSNKKWERQCPLTDKDLESI